jgi:hypothetical protein
MHSTDRRQAGLHTLLHLLLRKPWIVPVILVLGIVARLVWQGLRGADWVAGGEASNAAIAFAETGLLMDAYGVGHGLTAHVSPIPVIFAGSIYGLFGVQSAPSETLLALWSLGLAATSFLFMYRAFMAAGAPRLATIGGLAACAFLPLNFVNETVIFRVWEGTLAAALGSAVVYLVVYTHNDRVVGWGTVLLLSVLAALLFFINPALGLAAYAACALLTLRRMPVRRWIGVAAIATAVLATVITPWALRNQQALGKTVLLRSNFGLELALANHPAAAAARTGQEQHAAFYARLHEIHPYESQQALAEVKTVGEVQYAQALGAEARVWMLANPTATIRLTARHLVQFYFPPSWFWEIYEEGSVGLGLKQAMTWAISLLGLAGVALALFRGRQQFQYLAIMTLVPCLPYLIVQPVPRYRYLVYAPLVFFSAYLLVALLQWLLARFAPPTKPRRTVLAAATPA